MVLLLWPVSTWEHLIAPDFEEYRDRLGGRDLAVTRFRGTDREAQFWYAHSRFGSTFLRFVREKGRTSATWGPGPDEWSRGRPIVVKLSPPSGGWDALWRSIDDAIVRTKGLLVRSAEGETIADGDLYRLEVAGANGHERLQVAGEMAESGPLPKLLKELSRRFGRTFMRDFESNSSFATNGCR